MSRIRDIQLLANVIVIVIVIVIYAFRNRMSRIRDILFPTNEKYGYNEIEIEKNDFNTHG